MPAAPEGYTWVPSDIPGVMIAERPLTEDEQCCGECPGGSWGCDVRTERKAGDWNDRVALAEGRVYMRTPGRTNNPVTMALQDIDDSDCDAACGCEPATAMDAFKPDFTFPETVIPNVWSELVLSPKALEMLGLGPPEPEQPCFCPNCGMEHRAYS
jgi:hypothetical protein